MSAPDVHKKDCLGWISPLTDKCFDCGVSGIELRRAKLAKELLELSSQVVDAASAPDVLTAEERDVVRIYRVAWPCDTLIAIIDRLVGEYATLQAERDAYKIAAEVHRYG